ncbi:MAG: MoaD/ThiS family protein [Pseudomonadota bacterium]|nr:MoaD/ThiS family protein [Pseudomonadota bacterium]
MRVTALYFATLRERRGTGSEGVDLPVGTTASGAFALIFPGLSLTVAYAVNEATVGSETVLVEGDEVAFLPPLGGG